MMPFPGGIEATPNATLLLSLGAAVLYAITLNLRASFLLSVLKTLAVALLAVLAAMQGAPVLLVAALAVAALGDAFLSREGERLFLAGMAAFLVSHALYIALFWSIGAGVQVFAAEPWRAAAGGAMGLGALIMLAMLWRRLKPGLRLPIFVYTMAILAMGLAVLTTDHVLAIAGAAVFMASDSLLAAERFLVPAISKNRDGMRVAVWVLYYVAQLAIVADFLFA